MNAVKSATYMHETRLAQFLDTIDAVAELCFRMEALDPELVAREEAVQVFLLCVHELKYGRLPRRRTS